jgi:hypothetical protein
LSLRIAFVPLVYAAILAPVVSQARTMQQRLETACAGDVERLCPQTANGSDARKACMLARRSEVSAACMALIDASE